MKKRLAALVLALLASTLAMGTPAALANWCGASDRENWKEFASLFAAGPAPSAGRPVIYILGAPWCPYCAELFKALHNRRYAFDAEFVLGAATSDFHKDQIADAVSDGSEQSLIRVYMQHKAKTDAVTPTERDFINEVQVVTDTALKERFGAGVKTWGSPITFLLLNGTITVVPGMPNLEKIDTLLSQSPVAGTPPSTRAFIASPVPREAPVNGNAAFAVRDNVRLRILPSTAALSAGCLAAGQGLKVAGEVAIDGERWYVFKPYQPGTYLRVYGRADEMQLQ